MKALRFEAYRRFEPVVDCDFAFATATECIATGTEAQFAHAVSQPEAVM